MKRSETPVFVQEAQGCKDAAALRDLREQHHKSFLQQRETDAPLHWNQSVNEFHDVVIRRIITLAENVVCEERGEKVPLSYAFVLYGSGGRQELTLWSDQDNGLLYEEPRDGAQRKIANSFFEALALKISAFLEQAGYPPCSGRVICTNERWRKSINDYIHMLEVWLHEPNWENIRYLLIAADMRTIYGHSEFGDAIVRFLFLYLERHPMLYEHLLQNTLFHKVSIGIFGQLIKERYGEDAGGVDVKYGAYIPIVNGIRLLALEAGISATSSEERIRLLRKRNIIPDELAQDWTEALELALKLRSMTPFQKDDGMFNSRGKLTAEQLTKKTMSELKLCLRIGTELQKYVKKNIHSKLEQYVGQGEGE